MNTYTRLFFQHERHVYKRGRFAGSAPADKDRRGKTHFRVVKRGENMGVILHSTQIITAYPDGQVMLDANGFEDYPTTRKAYGTMGFLFYTQSNNGYKNTMVRMWDSAHTMGPAYVYYSGMVFNEAGVLVGEPAPEHKYVADKAERREFKATAKGFLEMLPILLATSEQRREATWATMGYHEGKAHYRDVRNYTHRTLALEQVESYPDLVDAWRHALTWYISELFMSSQTTITPQQVWTVIYRECTKDMRLIEPVTNI